MCGVAGLFAAAGIAESDTKAHLSSFQKSLAHRGPDGRGEVLFSENAGGFAHTRLALLDLSEHAAQPMSFEGGRAWLTFNGELYNYKSVAQEFQLLDRLGDAGDTAVLGALLARELTDESIIGACERILPKLRGMFAFGWYDSSQKKLVLARDAFGIKPLYYRLDGETLFFSSEVRALADTAGHLQLSRKGVESYLLWGAVQEPLTIFEGVHMLPAGSVLVASSEGGRLKFEIFKWADLPFSSENSGGGGDDEPLGEVVEKLLRDSVAAHLIADAPVGICLSSGIDSVALAKLARLSMGDSGLLTAFTVGYGREDEALDSQKLSALLQLDHKIQHVSTSEAHQYLNGYLQAMDQPTNDGLNTYCISRVVAAHGHKAALSGLGSDELFGGYPAFNRLLLERLLHACFRLAGRAGVQLAKSFGLLADWRLRRRAEAAFASSLDSYQGIRGLFPFEEVRTLLSAIDSEGAFLGSPGEAGGIQNCSHSCLESPRALALAEQRRYMRNQLLRDADVFGMAHSVEIRVPYCDLIVHRGLARFPERQVLASGKQALRDAVAGSPPKVSTGSKRAFLLPLQKWFSEEISGWGSSRKIPLTGVWHLDWSWYVLCRWAEINGYELP